LFYSQNGLLNQKTILPL